MSYRTSNISKPIGLRLSNKEIEVIDAITKLGAFESRTETIRQLLRPMLLQCIEVMNTKSITKGAKARIKAEVDFGKHIRLIQKNSNAVAQEELPLVDLPYVEPNLEVLPSVA
jgi:Arc/MetJ-type ribon-helix-helix transcriptional regulator